MSIKLLTSLVLLLSSGVAACGSATPVINPALQAGVDIYLHEAPNSGHYDELMTVDWGTPPNGALGQCEKRPQWDGSYQRHVHILKRGDAPIIVETLVAHELAHCLHDKGHDDSRYPRLMNSVLVEGEEKYWEANLGPEIEELFR